MASASGLSLPGFIESDARYPKQVLSYAETVESGVRTGRIQTSLTDSAQIAAVFVGE